MALTNKGRTWFWFYFPDCLSKNFYMVQLICLRLLCVTGICLCSQFTYGTLRIYLGDRDAYKPFTLWFTICLMLNFGDERIAFSFLVCVPYRPRVLEFLKHWDGRRVTYIFLYIQCVNLNLWLHVITSLLVLIKMFNAIKALKLQDLKRRPCIVLVVGAFYDLLMTC